MAQFSVILSFLRYLTFSIIDWIRIARDIECNYQNFDAFIILHGTDTMAYTASALSFMLEDLGYARFYVVILTISLIFNVMV